MSDYAGPILGVVGAVIGYFGTGGNPMGAYWGWTIGPAMGKAGTPDCLPVIERSAGWEV